MTRRNTTVSFALILTLTAAASAQTSTAVQTAPAVQDRGRAAVLDKYKWNLADLYPSEDAWRAAKDKLPPQIATIGAFKGTLGTSAARLADALDAANRISKDLQRVYVYASMLSDEDTRVSKHQGMQQEMQQIGASFGEQVSFIEP